MEWFEKIKKISIMDQAGLVNLLLGMVPLTMGIMDRNRDIKKPNFIQILFLVRYFCPHRR